MSERENRTTPPPYRAVVTNNDADDALRAIGRAIYSVCSDGNSDVVRVARDVVLSLGAAGFRIVRINTDA